MGEGCTPCNFLLPTVIVTSNPVELPPRGILARVLRPAAPIYRHVRRMLTPREAPAATRARRVPEREPLHMEPGEWVQVRSIEEINETLDGTQRYKGLYFMPDMERCCGGRFRVYKKVTTIKLEATGEIRLLRSPTVFLEGVYCNGERHGGCDRACFHFWREAWLERVPPPDAPQDTSAPCGGT